MASPFILTRTWIASSKIPQKLVSSTGAIINDHLRTRLLCMQYHPATTGTRHKINRPLKLKDEPINNLYEDPTLNVEPEREEHGEVWFNVKGYDFVHVESYMKFSHNFLKSLGLAVTQFPIPPRCWTISTFKPYSEIEDRQYELKKSHRILSIQGVPCNTLSLIVQELIRHVPAGVEFTVTEPDEEVIQFRYVPDGDIKALNQAIYDIDNPKLQKRKKGGS